jgi:hypothetical protein
MARGSLYDAGCALLAQRHKSYLNFNPFINQTRRTKDMATNSSFDAVQEAQHERIKQMIWSACIWSWPACLVGVVIPFMLIGGFIPPPLPSSSAREIANFFTAEPTHIRIGAMGFLYFSALSLMFYAVITEEMKKIEGNPALLARVQFGGAVILVTIFQLLGLAWLLASYRTDVNADIIRMLNDYCWFAWSMFIPTYVMQYVCIAIAGFMDKRPNPTWPRWAAFLNLWIAIGGSGGILAVFFKAGPFAWNGLIGFWIPVIIYAGGNCINTYLLLRRHKIEKAAYAQVSRSSAM